MEFERNSQRDIVKTIFESWRKIEQSRIHLEVYWYVHIYLLTAYILIIHKV